MPTLDPIAATEAERLDAIIRGATQALAAAGVETPALDARRLVAAATGLGAADLLARPERRLAARERQRLDELVRRRCAREPVARILGERDFFGRAFALTPATLEPRPDSETLIETVLALAHEQGWHETPLHILDVGTGSGCLLVTLLAELVCATGLGTDISAEALATAAANARRHGVFARAAFEQRDALQGVAGPFDLVVCNPPYIATSEIAELAPEVCEYDPPAALDGGADGLDVYRKTIPALAELVPCGWVVFEVGAGQADAVAALLREPAAGKGGGTLRFHKDLGGHARCVAMEIQL